MRRTEKCLKVFILLAGALFIFSGAGHAGSALIPVSSATYDCGGADVPYGVAVDASGNIFVTGSYDVAGDSDWCTVKYDKNLVALASATYNGSGDDFARGVAVDPSGNIFVTGSINNASQDWFTIKYSPNLVVLASATYDGSGDDGANGVAVDPSGNIIVTGAVNDNNDWFTIKYSPNLVALASATYDGPDNLEDVASEVAVDPSGNIIVAGYVTTGSSTSWCVVKYSSNLVSLASATYSSNSIAIGVATDASGNIIVTGYVTVGANQEDWVTIKYDPNLVMLASATIAGDGYDEQFYEGWGVATDASGNIIVTGVLESENGYTRIYDPNLVPIAGTPCWFGAQRLYGVAIDASGYIIVTGYRGKVAGGDYFTVKYWPGQNAATGNIGPSSASELTISPESGVITVGIPAGAFGESVTVAVATVTVPASEQSTIRVTRVGIEITNDKGLQPGKDITLTVLYRDADIAGLEESKLSLARYDNGRWILIPTVVYADQNKLVGTVKHLSTFAVVQLVPAADLAGVKAYPNPFNPRNGVLILANLTGEADIKIYNVAGELVRTLSYTTANGQATWDGKNDAGNAVASGVYLAFIKSDAGKKIIKIAVER